MSFALVFVTVLGFFLFFRSFYVFEFFEKFLGFIGGKLCYI